MGKRIRLTNFSLYTLVSDEDFVWAMQFKWRLAKQGYVVRSAWEDGKTKVYAMHRELLKAPKGIDVEHADQNRLNNQRDNLRLATRSQNMANVQRSKKATAHSKYKGVSYLKNKDYNLKKPWMSYIKVEYKMYYNGYYETEAEAAHIYNQFAEQIFGEFAYLNDID